MLGHHARAGRRRGTSLGRLTLAVLSVAALVAPAASAAGGGTEKAFESDGDCEQIGAFVPVAVENVRPLVASDFAIVGEAAGVATVLVTGGRCRNWEIDGVPGGDLVFGLVSVVGHPREQEGPSGDGYDLWWLSGGDTSFHARLSALGAFSRHVAGVAYTSETVAGGTVTARLEVPWGESPFSIEAVLGDAPAPGFPDNIPSTHWTRGRHGRVLGQHVNTDGQADPAVLVVRAAPGSPLARILGTETLAVPGALLRFHHHAVTGLAADPS